MVTKGTILGLKDIVTPKGAKQLTTPVGIVQSSSDAVSAGYYPGLLAFISLALAIFNLLPFLPLDGGHILFALAEKVYRRPIPRVVFERVSVVGIVLMLMLFTVGLNNDIGRSRRPLTPELARPPASRPESGWCGRAPRAGCGAPHRDPARRAAAGDRRPAPIDSPRWPRDGRSASAASPSAAAHRSPSSR